MADIKLTYHETIKYPVTVKCNDNGFSFTYVQSGILCTRELVVGQLMPPVVHRNGNAESNLIVQYVKLSAFPSNEIRAKLSEARFTGSHQNCSYVFERLKFMITNQEGHRPQRLLLFVNPGSGSQSTVREYQNIVAPIFKKCGVEVETIITESPEHPTQVLETYDLDSVDGVVSMGGDGSVCQVTTGLIKRYTKDASLKANEESEGLTREDEDNVKVKIRVGAIPGGSGNVVAFYTGGAVDVETCVLSIALGRSVLYDVMVIRDKRQIVGYSNIISGHGCIANAFISLEKLRYSLGRHRYWLVLPMIWWNLQQFDAEIDFLPVDKDERELELQLPDYPVPTSSLYDIVDGPHTGWKTLKCKVIEVSVTQYGQRHFYHDVHTKKSFVKRNLNTGKMVLSISMTNSLLDTINVHNIVVHKGTDRLPRQKVEQLEVKAVNVRRMEHGRDAVPKMHVDGETTELIPGNDLYSASVNPGCLRLFSLDKNLVTPLLSQN